MTHAAVHTCTSAVIKGKKGGRIEKQLLGKHLFYLTDGSNKQQARLFVLLLAPLPLSPAVQPVNTTLVLAGLMCVMGFSTACCV